MISSVLLLEDVDMKVFIFNNGGREQLEDQ